MLQRTLPSLLATLALAGCTSEESRLPAACVEGEDAVRAALRTAPEPVRLGGATLSSCLSEEADGEQLQVVGVAFVEAASRLAAEARRRPEGRSALELGYLVAAAHRGGDSTQGVHSELLRRLDGELATVDTSSRAFRRGRRAGQEAG
jgi:hypothetical protein